MTPRFPTDDPTPSSHVTPLPAGQEGLEEAGFTARLLEEPRDVTARLVFADWLEERGFRARAEYLRTVGKSKFIRRVREWGGWALFPTPVMPPRVAEPYAFVTGPPPVRSSRCDALIRRAQRGWRPSMRVRTLGYSARAVYFGVYVWEEIHVLWGSLTGG